MRLCSDCAQSLVDTVTFFHQQVSSFIECIFLGTAFLEILRIEETLTHPSHDVVEYTSVTHADGRRGMRIEARYVNALALLFFFERSTAC